MPRTIKVALRISRNRVGRRVSHRIFRRYANLCFSIHNRQGHRQASPSLLFVGPPNAPRSSHGIFTSEPIYHQDSAEPLMNLWKTAAMVQRSLRLSHGPIPTCNFKSEISNLKCPQGLLARFAVRIRNAAGFVLRNLSHRHNMRSRNISAALFRRSIFIHASHLDIAGRTAALDPSWLNTKLVDVDRGFFNLSRRQGA